jgi:hypothetical protein
VSTAKENKAIARRFEEELAKGNLDVIDELLSPDFVDRSLMPGQGPTRENYKLSMKESNDAFPITSITIEEQVAEGDTLQLRASANRLTTFHTWRLSDRFNSLPIVS